MTDQMLGMPTLATPFISTTDSTRAQMSSKQLSQTTCSLNCRRPYVIANTYYYLTETAKGFLLVADTPGRIVYYNDEIMVIIFNLENGQQKLETYDVPAIKVTSQQYATQLRYKRTLGDFDVDDIIFEYDMTADSTPTYGYNFNTAFINIAGYNFEDAIIISESVAKIAKMTKTETIMIPIYAYSLFSNIYSKSKYKFIPEIGQTISEKALAIQLLSSAGNSKISVMKSLKIYDINSISETNNSNSDMFYNSEIIESKLASSKVIDIKIHGINKNNIMLDKGLQTRIEKLYNDYSIKVSSIHESLKGLLGEKYAKQLLLEHYVMGNSKRHLTFDKNDLMYVIEVKLVKEYPTKIGSKLANRYANKGIVSMIIPDHMRPINTKTGQPIDVMLSSLGVFSRMNFGQIIEGLVAKVIQQYEQKIINDPDHTHTYLKELVPLAEALESPVYAQEILELANMLEVDNDIKEQFVIDVEESGLMFEAPSFADIDIVSLRKVVKDIYNLEVNDDIRIPNSLFEFVSDKAGLEIPLPENDISYPHIFNAPIYTQKLKQNAEDTLNARDFGDYSSGNKQPMKRGAGKSARVGNMEFDALLASNLLQTIREMRSVKSDGISLKSDLVDQIVTSGSYNLPNTVPPSYTKRIIDSLLTFVSNGDNEEES